MEHPQIYIEVKNKNSFLIKDAYDGVEYVMMPGQVTTLPFMWLLTSSGY